MKHCQDGKVECGFLIGNVCKADRNRPFVVTDKFNRKLSIVGCMSWSRYLDYGKNTMPELPVKQMGVGNNLTKPGEKQEEHDSVPMHILQESDRNRRGGNPGFKDTIGRNMTPCDICGEQSVIQEPDGHHYCQKHHVEWTKCKTHDRMVKEHGMSKL